MNKIKKENIKICQIVYSGYGGHTDLALDLSKNFVNEFSKVCLIFYGYQNIPVSYINFCKTHKITYRKLKLTFFLIDWWKIFFFLTKLKCNVLILHTGTIVPVFFYKLIYRAKLISAYHQSIYLKTSKEKFRDYVQFYVSNINIVITKIYYDYFFKMFNKKNIFIISNGIEIPKTFKEKKNKRKKIINFGMASRFIKTKGHKLLIECFENLPNNMVLKFVGTGDDETELKKILIEKNIKNIHFEGYVEKNNMSNWFNSIDYYVHISDGETMSLSIMQAMAMGKVIIASNVSGIKNIISHKHNGYLVKNTKTNIIKSIKNIANYQNQNSIISNNAKNFAKKNFDLRITVRKYQNLIYKLFNEKYSS